MKLQPSKSKISITNKPTLKVKVEVREDNKERPRDESPRRTDFDLRYSAIYNVPRILQESFLYGKWGQATNIRKFECPYYLVLLHQCGATGEAFGLFSGST